MFYPLGETGSLQESRVEYAHPKYGRPWQNLYLWRGGIYYEEDCGYISQ